MNSRRSLIESSAKRLCDSINDEVSRCKKVCMENEEVCTSLKKAAEEEAAATKAEAAKRAAEVDAERSELRAEKVAMEGLHAVATAGPIELDVGGTRFSTSRSTLVRVEGSMLEAMFSGRHALAPSSDGSYFIDRVCGAPWLHTTQPSLALLPLLPSSARRTRRTSATS